MDPLATAIEKRLPPDFLRSLGALARFMRLSLLKAAHAVLSSAACRKSGSGQFPEQVGRIKLTGIRREFPSAPVSKEFRKNSRSDRWM
jgi:hypothetical protein